MIDTDDNILAVFWPSDVIGAPTIFFKLRGTCTQPKTVYALMHNRLHALFLAGRLDRFPNGDGRYRYRLPESSNRKSKANAATGNKKDQTFVSPIPADQKQATIGAVSSYLAVPATVVAVPATVVVADAQQPPSDQPDRSISAGLMLTDKSISTDAAHILQHPDTYVGNVPTAADDRKSAAVGNTDRTTVPSERYKTELAAAYANLTAAMFKPYSDGPTTIAGNQTSTVQKTADLEIDGNRLVPFGRYDEAIASLAVPSRIAPPPALDRLLHPLDDGQLFVKRSDTVMSSQINNIREPSRHNTADGLKYRKRYIERRLWQERAERKSYGCDIADCVCRFGELDGKPIGLRLVYKNDDVTDDRLDNLRLVCPNHYAVLPEQLTWPLIRS